MNVRCIIRIISFAGFLSLHVPACAQQSDRNTLFFISNSHLDTQWNWDVRTTIGEYIKNTMEQNFALLDKYPNLRFNYEGAIKYMWMKEYYPDSYLKLKNYISDGRWHVSGCSIDATDAGMMSSAESMLHSMLLARKFYKREFGVDGGNDIMLPDCFGFSYALPSLARHAGIHGFHTQKLSWGCPYTEQLPPFGIWQGVDGSQIYAIYKGHAYDAHEEFNKDMSRDAAMLKTIKDNYESYGLAAEMRYVGPRSDHGGGLHDEAGSNGENTPYWLNYSATAGGPIDVKIATPDEIFDYMDVNRSDKYQVWDNELPMRIHGVGSYTSRTMFKMWNRRNELLADAAEKASSLARWLGVQQYPQSTINDAWVRTIWQQHHDGITGTSIPAANAFAVNDYVITNKTLANTLSTAVGNIAKTMNTNVGGTPIVVYNPLSFDRTDIVEGSMQGAETTDITVYDQNGNEVLAQVTGYDKYTSEVKFIFAATVPSLGCAVYDIRLGTAGTLSSALSIDKDKRQLSNGRYRLTVNSAGDVAQVYDVQNNRPMLSRIQQELYNDYSPIWPSWEIRWDDVRSEPVAKVDEDVDISLAEDGVLRKSYRVSRTKNGSGFVQYIRMSAITDRIDCVNEVDWQSRGMMLKANFALYLGNEKTTYDTSLGAIQRGIRNENLYEVSGHQWADVSNPQGTFGVSIINDCKYGWDKPGTNNMHLTLIHTPRVDNNYTYQQDQDLGVNKFTYSIYPHAGTWSDNTQKEASQLNQQLVGFIADKHEGQLGREVRFVDVSNGKVAVKALKKAEDSDEMIVRVYELTGDAQQDVTLTFPSDIVEACEANAMEEKIGDVVFAGNTLTFSIGRYQPKTFALRLKPSAVAQTVETTNTTHVDLPYNVDLMSSDSRRDDALATAVYAYPAELISDEIETDGVTFRMGSRADGAKNALRCQSQTLRLNRSEKQNKLYLLMASTSVNGSEGEFITGETVSTISVPYFAGFAATLDSPYNGGTSYRKDDIAFTATHRHKISTGSDEPYRFLYIYKYVLPLADGVNEVTLPRRHDLYVLAASLSDNKADDIKPFTNLNTYIDYTELGDVGDSGCGKELRPSTVNCSNQNGTAEAAVMAADKDEVTKWCVTESQNKTPWIEYQFTGQKTICKWMVLNAGSEHKDYISRSFKLQRYENERWVDVDIVEENTENKVVRGVTPFTASRVRMQMIQGEQKRYTTRIFVFAVYGENETTGITNVCNHEESAVVLHGNDPNPCKNVTAIQYEVADGISNVTLRIYGNNGQSVEQRNIPVTTPGPQTYTYNGNLQPGIYLYRLTATQKGREISTETMKLVIN